MDYKGLFEVYKKRLDYVYHKSALFNKNFIHNIRQSGDNVEVEVRALFRQILPHRYRITSGYIVHAENKNDSVKVSGQLDMIILDTLVPHSIFSLDDKQEVEVVPLEAVVGIFEIKRTLNCSKLKEAVEHLHEVCETLEINKANSDEYLPGGVKIEGTLKGGYPPNPMLGILSIACEDEVFGGLEKLEYKKIDVVACLGKFLYAPRDKENINSFRCYTIHEKDMQYMTLKAQSEAEFSSNFAATMGYISGYLQHVSGRPLDPNAYFFHRDLK